MGLYGTPSAGLVFANVSQYFVSQSGTAASITQEWWSTDIPTGATTGPFTSMMQATSTGPAWQSTGTDNWAGWEFNGGRSTPTIGEAWVATQTVSMSPEPSQQTLPSGYSPVDSVAGDWVGLSPYLGGPAVQLAVPSFRQATPTMQATRAPDGVRISRRVAIMDYGGKPSMRGPTSVWCPGK